MSTYSEASQLKEMLKGIVNEMIENHPLVKSAIKAKKAVVWETPNTTAKTVKVKLLPDILSPNSEPLTLGYNLRVENYLINATPQKTAVWISYTYSINNAIVDNDGARTL